MLHHKPRKKRIRLLKTTFRQTIMMTEISIIQSATVFLKHVFLKIHNITEQHTIILLYLKNNKKENMERSILINTALYSIIHSIHC